MDYEVYIGKVDGRIVYVGEGQLGRHQHLNSGTSHVYEANRVHFTNKEIEIEIYGLFLTKQAARVKESELITLHMPEWNKTLGFKSDFRKKVQNSLRFATRTKSSAYHILKVVEPWLCEDRTYVINRAMKKKADYIKPIAPLLTHFNQGKGKLPELLESFEKTGTCQYTITFKESFYNDPQAFIRKHFR